MRGITAKISSIMLLLPALGCNSPTEIKSGGEPARVEVSVSPANLVLPVGEGLQLTVSMTGVDSTPLGAAGVDIQWTSSDDAIVAVSRSGLVQARGVGTATITAIVTATCGTHMAQAGVNVTPNGSDGGPPAGARVQ